MATTKDHTHLLSLVNPLVDYMKAQGYHFLLVAGKDNLCTLLLRADAANLAGMLQGMLEHHPEIAATVREALNHQPTE